MSNLASLTAQRDGLLKKIREIEAACEGIENENNAKRVQELNLEQTQYSAQRQEIAAKIGSSRWKISSYKCRDNGIRRDGCRKNS